MSATEIQRDDILYSPGLVQQQRSGVYLLIDPSAPNWASFNSLGGTLVRRCDGRHTLAEVADSFHDEFGVIPANVTSFVNRAAEAGFISSTPDVSPTYQGRAQSIAPVSLEELWINTNSSCPLRCKHCLVDGGSESVTPLSTVEIENVVDQAVGLGAGRVYFTGGEPLLRNDLLSLVQYATQRVQLVILTSGVLVSRERASQLKAASNGNLLMQVSLDGPDALTNDAIRGVGNFDRAVDGIKRLVDVGLSPIVTTTLMRLNYRKAADTTRFLESLGVRDHHILWLHGRGRMRENVADLLVSGADVAQVMDELRQTTGGMNIIVDNHESIAVRVRGRRGRKNDLCNSGYGILSVSADGRVYPCAALCGAANFDCGSIKEKSLRDIWQESTVVKWIRDNSVQKRVGCSSCFLKFFCGGGCFAQSYFNYEMTTGEGCIMAPDPYCDAYKSQIMDSMWQFAMPNPDEKMENRPMLYRQMENELPSCAIGGNKVLDAAFDVGTYHCSCVLAMDAK